MPRPHLRLARAGSAGGTTRVTSAAVGGEFPATLWTVRPIVLVAHGQMTQPLWPSSGDRFGCMDNSIDSGVDTSRPASLLRPPSVPANLESLRALQLERLRWSLRHAYENVPHYRARSTTAGVTPDDLRELADLARFPFTAKADLRDNYPFGMFAVPREKVVAHPRLQRHDRASPRWSATPARTSTPGPR